MSEKRKPTFVYLAKNLRQKKTYKIEVFPASLWADNFKPWEIGRATYNHNIYNAYRLRVNGRWFKLKKWAMAFLEIGDPRSSVQFFQKNVLSLWQHVPYNLRAVSIPERNAF